MTPTIDQLAANGTRFSKAFSACPVCVPARRTLMTGMSARGHGDRNFHNSLRLPEVPTLVQCFRDAGYQTSAVGKLHVYPQRSRIGFDEVILNEEGRHTDGMSLDDWERFLVDAGYPGQEYAAGGCNNDYHVTPWHLPDHCHPTNWTAREMCRTITRRDPDRPAFWYLSFTAPHPPLWPLGQYLEQYQKMPMAPPAEGDWVKKFKGWNLSRFRSYAEKYAITTGSPDAIALSRRAFYAMVTHVDHQIRVVLGTLREAGLLDNTIVAFTSDHGEMLGAHSLWAKAVHYEPSISVPFIIAPPASWGRPRGVKDDRLVELRDLMPTLLELADLPVPKHVEGLSAFSSARRSEIYGEYQSGINATRMIRESTFKLIYYPEGNRFQLFDLTTDPKECRDLACDSEHTETLERMKTKLATELYDGDEDWIKDGQWVGLSESQACVPQATDYGAQRGLRFL
jgi:arylsulfatase A-like enzyme